MRNARIIRGGAACVVAAGVLAGCQVNAEFGASCQTSPPVPHHSNGVVHVSADLPPRVDAGSTFTVTVDMMGADAGAPGGETMPTGTLGVSGGVSPSGNFAVGQGPFGGPAFPVELEFTATGEPGDTITFRAVSGSGVLGTLPNAVLVTCTPAGEAIIATTEITAPAPQDSAVGSGTAEFEVDGQPGRVETAFDVDVQDRPGGQAPTGTVAFPAFFASAAATCLDVRTVGVGTLFDEATMNLSTAELGLVTLEISDGDPEGLPDFITMIADSPRDPADCSEIVFGSETHRGFVETGNVDLFNADP